MFIRILTSRERIPVGTEIDVLDEKAVDWIAAGDAELIASPVPVIETAVASEPVETRGAKKGKK